MVAGPARVLRRASRLPDIGRGNRAFRHHPGPHSHGGRRRRARPCHPLLRRPFACTGPRHSRGGGRRLLPERDLQPAGFGRLLALFHPVDSRKPAGCLGRRGQVRPYQYLYGEAPDGELGHRPLHGLHHRALQLRCQRPHLEPPRARFGRHSRHQAAAFTALPPDGRNWACPPDAPCCAAATTRCWRRSRAD
jgi:hypothetical protein